MVKMFYMWFDKISSAEVSTVALLGALLSALRPSRCEGLHPCPGARNSFEQPTLEQLLPRRQRPPTDGLRHRLVPSALPRVPWSDLCRDSLGRTFPEKSLRPAQVHLSVAPHRGQAGVIVIYFLRACNLLMFAISQSVCPFQAFPDQ